MTRATAGSWRCRGGGAAAHLGEAPGGEGRGPMDIWISSSFYPNQSNAFGSWKECPGSNNIHPIKSKVG